MKAISAIINQMDQDVIATFERDGKYNIEANGEQIELSLDDVEIMYQRISQVG
jgi:hypothetical protein